MGHLKELIAQSPDDLLRSLGVSDVEDYQKEFKELIEAQPDLMIEDWSTEPELLEVFYCWVRHTRPHTIVEIGAYKGKSAFVFASAQKRNDYGELYSIDSNEEGTISEAAERLESVGRPEKIRLLERTSQMAFSEWIRAKIDFLYIDGSHEYLDAVLDFALWSRHLSDEGVIAMHDTIFRLERCFPHDYVFPQSYYDCLHVKGMKKRLSGHEWKGVGFITKATSLPDETI